jgi:hypothetical protein
MSRKVKVKVKHGKAKIKLKGGDEGLPLSAPDIRLLLASSVASALGAGRDRPSGGRLAESLSIDTRPLLPEHVAEPANDESTS